MPMKRPQGLVSRLKVQDAARKSKTFFTKSIAFGTPILILVLAIGLTFMSESTWLSRENNANVNSRSGWAMDVAEQKKNGDILFQAQHFDPALKYYFRALNIATRHEKEKTVALEETKLMRSYLANNVAMTYVQLGNDTQAATWYKYGLDIDNNHVELHYNYANLCMREEKWVVAEGHYRTVLKLKPNFPPAMLSLGYVLQQQGAFDDALVLLLDAWDLEKNDADIPAQLGWLHMAKQDALKALEWLSIAADMGHEEAQLQRIDLMNAWLKTQETMKSQPSNGNHDSDTITLSEPVL